MANHKSVKSLQTQRISIKINGIVQGVGFRPFIFNLAKALGLSGFVTNTNRGVYIEAQGNTAALRQFLERIPREAPPLSEITEIRHATISIQEENEFRIRASRRQKDNQTLISPDVSVCPQCLSELFDPSDRRYRYPFINCTNCGPRFTIIKNIPYDRPMTTMAKFTMCPACQKEYDDPGDRRFHAQPNACPDCGPHLWYDTGHGTVRLEGDEVAIDRAAQDILAGKIVAVKGLGGFHLAVDATNNAAVQELRRRKNRYEKPLALMVFDLETAQSIVELEQAAEKLLTGIQSPIVLLPRKPSSPVAEQVAPGNHRLGIMLPYTPLHYLLLDRITSLGGKPAILVMTSANLSEEPIAIDNQDARERLSTIADGFVMHNRDILVRADDSVLFLIDGQTQFLRRSRGYVPKPLFLKQDGPDILALGGQLKNTICCLKDKRAFLSQHIGDLENLAALTSFEQAIDHFRKILVFEPEFMACDLHPEYESTRWAEQNSTVPLFKIQHHHAHMAAVMVEHDVSGPSIGLILDGTGYGYDHTIWGGEIFVGSLTHIKRVAWLEAVPLPGGEAAIKNPWRMAYSYLYHAFGAELPELPFLKQVNAGPVQMLLTKHLHSPLTSSCGRLFDGVAAMSGGRLSVSYEAQAAIEMTQAVQNLDVAPFEFEASLPRIPLKPLIRDVARAIQNKEDFSLIAARFHKTLVELFTEILKIVRIKYGLNDVILSGGVFQNEILLPALVKRLRKEKFRVFVPRQVPANDGGIALGQAVIARALAIKGLANPRYEQED